MMRPVAATNVKEFMASDRTLKARIEQSKSCRKQNERRGEAEGDGRFDMGRKAELGVSSQAGPHLFKQGTGVGDRQYGHGSSAESPELHQAEHEQREPCGDPGKDDDADNRSDRIKARKLPTPDGAWRWNTAERFKTDGLNSRGCRLCAMPRLKKWEKQRDGQNDPPIKKKHAWLANPEETRK